MAITKVDTFEHDIADEIRHKEASITDIASAIGDLGNDNLNEESSNKTSMITVILVVSFLILSGLGYFGYTYYVKANTPIQPIEERVKEETKKTGQVSLQNISPVLNRQLGTYLTDIQKTNKGYSMTITSYSPVFSYMIKNEKAFAEEIATAVGNTKIPQAKATTTPVIPQTSTTTATTTLNQASSTQEEEKPQTEYIFSDITVSNQNIRIAKTIYGTVVYAFVGTQKLIIASSVENLLALRSSTLHK